MRIKADAKALIADLKKFAEDNQRKMKYMVAMAARELANVAVENTPIAPEDWANRAWYRRTYEFREEKYGIEQSPGFHKGAWVYSEQANVALDPTTYSWDNVADTVNSTVQEQYRLGEDFYILAKGPAFAGLEAGLSPRAPDGIMQPTLDEIIKIYKINLVSYYQRG